VPKSGGQEANIDEATRVMADARAAHYWDGGGLLVKAYKALLGLPVDAWDIYFLYGPKARWEGDAPPLPELWMHQLWMPDSSHDKDRLDAARFAARAGELLGDSK
jgi:hypothetical protein